MNIRGSIVLEDNYISPSNNTLWITTTGKVGYAGLAMGVMGLTYSKSEVYQYTLKYKSLESDIVTIQMEK